MFAQKTKEGEMLDSKFALPVEREAEVYFAQFR
jgi:hypothetical protein